MNNEHVKSMRNIYLNTNFQEAEYDNLDNDDNCDFEQDDDDSGDGVHDNH